MTDWSCLKSFACFCSEKQGEILLLLLKSSELAQRLTQSREAESTKAQDCDTTTLTGTRTVRDCNNSNNHRWEQRNLPRTAATVGAIKELSWGRRKSRNREEEDQAEQGQSKREQQASTERRQVHRNKCSSDWLGELVIRWGGGLCVQERERERTASPHMGEVVVVSETSERACLCCLLVQKPSKDCL